MIVVYRHGKCLEEPLKYLATHYPKLIYSRDICCDCDEIVWCLHKGVTWIACDRCGKKYSLR